MPMQTDASVTEIASKTGLHSAHNLCRVFKQKTGMSPQTYRANSR